VRTPGGIEYVYELYTKCWHTATAFYGGFSERHMSEGRLKNIELSTGHCNHINLVNVALMVSQLIFSGKHPGPYSVTSGICTTMTPERL